MLDSEAAEAAVGEVVSIGGSGAVTGKKGGRALIRAIVWDELVTSIDVTEGAPGDIVEDEVDTTFSAHSLEVPFDSSKTVDVTIGAEVVCAEAGTTEFQFLYDLFDADDELFDSGSASMVIDLTCVASDSGS